MSRIIFHIDVNSAFLSWEAIDRLQHGETIDLREIPSIVGGDPKKRSGIVLAKSIPAKKYGVKTAHTLVDAFKLCPHLVSVPPRYNVYTKASKAMMALLREYSPSVEIFSIDECFLDYTSVEHLFGSPVEAATAIKDRIKEELGFTVNIGISTNKLLAKMASDFKKPDNVHTLFPDEVEKKLWPLEVSELFMVGRATEAKLLKYGIYTVGDLANSDLAFLRHILKSHGELIYNFAWGRDVSIVGDIKYSLVKSIGNSTTIPYDITERIDAYNYMLSLSESVGMRLRAIEMRASVVAIHIKTNGFNTVQKQHKLLYTISSTNDIYEEAKRLFDLLWDGTPIRHLGVRVSQLQEELPRQLYLLKPEDEKIERLDQTIDDLRERFGKEIISRASLVRTRVHAMSGGVGDDEYPNMRSLI
ncbi:DNA polymerase IV [Acidaminobacter sp. JC074]|uniref:DNA polymerase Y family protein n=1 Tax=Acidaminobacter sp. JC074 TaxID=2530199 RepID=UPI001F115DBC|nr:DNA polymerase IV [Acidaminobacter sp. JC074]MCH4888036.1 DNA polymerase IV [Acidaminobacter sp. JC074]